MSLQRQLCVLIMAMSYMNLTLNYIDNKTVSLGILLMHTE